MRFLRRMDTLNNPYDVIIIGCGPAGIAAGLEFQKYQSIPKFLILEARNRVGGRVYTDTQTFVSNEPIDLGARWIHHYRPENPLSLHYIPSEKDQIHYDFFVNDGTFFFDIDGTPVSDNLLDQAKKIVEDYCQDIEKYPTDKDDISMLDVIQEKYNQIQDEQMRRLVDMNLAYIEHYEASNLDQLSAKSYLKSDSDVEVCDLTLSNGLGNFIKQIVERNQLPVQLNTIVTNINIPEDKNNFIRIITQDHREYLSKYVLITIPLGCLKAQSIKFTPSLPDWKQNAIDKMGFGLLNKIFLQFPFTFWDEKIKNIFIASNRCRFFICLRHDHMLVLYVTGSLAYELEQQTDEDVIEQTLEDLRRIYSDIPQPIKWLITRWGSDPFAYGSYSNFKIGAIYETTEELARDCYDRRIYWAGEHANYGGTIGCVDSAFESGHREAKRIYGNLNQDK